MPFYTFSSIKVSTQRSTRIKGVAIQKHILLVFAATPVVKFPNVLYIVYWYSILDCSTRQRYALWLSSPGKKYRNAHASDNRYNQKKYSCDNAKRYREQGLHLLRWLDNGGSHCYLRRRSGIEWMKLSRINGRGRNCIRDKKKEGKENKAKAANSYSSTSHMRIPLVR